MNLSHRENGVTRLPAAPMRRAVGAMASFLAAEGVALVVMGSSGCAMHYYDAKTGTEHVWGLGHVKMKVTPPREGVQAVVRGAEMMGFYVGAEKENCYLGLGWDNRREISVNTTNSSVRLEWPDSDFFNVRVGSLPPFLTNVGQFQPLHKETKEQ